MAAMIPLGNGTFIDPLTGRMTSGPDNSMGLAGMPPSPLMGLGNVPADTTAANHGQTLGLQGMPPPPVTGMGDVTANDTIPYQRPWNQPTIRAGMDRPLPVPPVPPTPFALTPETAGPLGMPPPAPQVPPAQLPFQGPGVNPQDIRPPAAPAPQAPPPAPAAPPQAAQPPIAPTAPAAPPAAQATPQAPPQGTPPGPSAAVPAQMVAAAIYGQESGSGANPRTSVNGARGGMQIIPETFARFAQPGENIDNPADNLRVGQRMIDKFHAAYGGDPARIAVAYFSGEGNVAPAGSPTPWKEDRKDGNGKTVSGYVNDIMGRLGDPRFDGKFPASGSPQQAPGWQEAAPGNPKAPPAQLPGMGMSGVDPASFRSSFGDQMLALGTGMMGGGTFSDRMARAGGNLLKQGEGDKEREMKGLHLANDTARQESSTAFQKAQVALGQQRIDQTGLIQGRRADTAEAALAQHGATAAAALAEKNRAAQARETMFAEKLKNPMVLATYRQSQKEVAADLDIKRLEAADHSITEINSIVGTIDGGKWQTSSLVDSAKKTISRALGSDFMGVNAAQIDMNDKQVQELSNALVVATGIRVTSGRELKMIAQGFAQVGTNPEAVKAMVLAKRDELLAYRAKATEWSAMPEDKQKEIMTGRGYGNWGRMFSVDNAPHGPGDPVNSPTPTGGPVYNPTTRSWAVPIQGAQGGAATFR